MEPDINKPLTIKRTDVITRLQENLDAEVKKREDEEAKNEEARKESLAAIAAFTPDELYNIFKNNYTVDVEDMEWDKKHKSFVSVKTTPTKVEGDLEKFVRVLKMATDESIEITPQQELYKLL